ncbi:MAG: flippase [Actinomycetota bacterium]
MSDLQQEFQESLGKIAGGMFVVFLGFVASSVFHFLERMVLFRGLSKSDYGVIMLGAAILEFTVIMAELGMRSGSPRFISYYRGKKDEERIKGAVYATLKIGLISSCAFAVAFFAASGPLAGIFDAPQLTSITRIFAIGLPFMVFIILLSSIFRGFDRVGVKAVFEDTMMWGLIAALMFVALVTDSGLTWAAAALASAAVITCSLTVVYAVRNLPRLLAPVKPVKMGKALILFSIPLAVEGVLNMVMTWADTFMLGIFKTTETVGAYNTAVPFVNLLFMFMLSLIYIFLPVTTKLLSEGKKEQINGIYRSSTKWAMTLTMPLLFIYVLFSEQVITFFAGARYAEASTALVILSLGMSFNVFAGPNGMTLVALGKPRLVLADGTAGVITNVALCWILIPRYGMTGAAIATLSSYVVINVLKSAQIYYLERIHPFTPQYLKPLLLSVLGAVVTYPLFSWALAGRDWCLVPLYFAYLAMGMLMLLLSRCLEAEDVTIICFVLMRMKIRPDRVRDFLNRFVAGAQ